MSSGHYPGICTLGPPLLALSATMTSFSLKPTALIPSSHLLNLVKSLEISLKRDLISSWRTRLLRLRGRKAFWPNDKNNQLSRTRCLRGQSTEAKSFSWARIKSLRRIWSGGPEGNYAIILPYQVNDRGRKRRSGHTSVRTCQLRPRNWPKKVRRKG